MALVPRPYQQEAINAGLEFFDSKLKGNAIEICPTGSGKSLIIAGIAGGSPGKTVILQPSKEILQQNFEKYNSYGFRAGIYSASAGMKYMDDVTFATIGSVARKHHLFKDVKKYIIDECHVVNPETGQYHDFIKAHDKNKVLGLTATPYRLHSSFEGAQLRFITRTSPRIFNKIVYQIQNQPLFDAGYLAPLKYWSFDAIDRNRLKLNTSGTDFTQDSLRQHYREIDMIGRTIEMANRLLKQRNNLLVFCSLISEAENVAKGIPGAVVVHGETSAADRDDILKKYKRGIIKCVVNVGVLTTGFDFPGLEAVLIAKSTMSLALYYQIIGRVMRFFRYPNGTIKEGWIVDLGNNCNFFGRIETMMIEDDIKGLPVITNVVNGVKKQLTNVTFRK